jgi:spermidine synthase
MSEDGELLTEWLNGECGFFIRGTKLLEKFRSRHQEVEVWETRQYGKLFRLDGAFMTSEADEFYYHENLAHLPAITHPGPASALVIGGGDGGSAEELFKHPTLSRITLVELDEAVVDIARRHLHSVHRGSLDDPRLTLRIQDGAAYVREAKEQYDLIVLDLTDPGTPATALYTAEFYRACAARLAPGGALSLHVMSPVTNPEYFRQAVTRLREVFACVRPYLVAIPLYGSLWGMACAADALDPLRLSPDEVETRLKARGIKGLRYYSGDMHQAMLALPNFVRQMLSYGHACSTGA